jgi:hypothetical protein
MSIWEEHRDQFHFEEMERESEYYLHAAINASFTKVLAQALLKNKHKNK